MTCTVLSRSLTVSSEVQGPTFTGVYRRFIEPRHYPPELKARRGGACAILLLEELLLDHLHGFRRDISAHLPDYLAAPWGFVFVIPFLRDARFVVDRLALFVPKCCTDMPSVSLSNCFTFHIAQDISVCSRILGGAFSGHRLIRAHHIGRSFHLSSASVPSSNIGAHLHLQHILMTSCICGPV